jgi:hypothetical protein
MKDSSKILTSTSKGDKRPRHGPADAPSKGNIDDAMARKKIVQVAVFLCA